MSFKYVELSDADVPRIPVDYLDAINAFYRRRGAISGAAFGHQLKITSSFGAEPSRYPFCFVEFDINDDQGVALVQPPLMDLIFGSLEKGIDFSNFPASEIGVLLELALNDILQAIEAGIGAKITVRSVSLGSKPIEDLSSYFTFNVSVAEGSAYLVHVSMPAHALLKFAHYLEASAPNALDANDVSGLPLAASVRVGAVVLTNSELKDLKTGDVVMLDQTGSPSPRAAFIVAESLAAEASVHDGKVIVHDALRFAQGTHLEKLTKAGLELDAYHQGVTAPPNGIPVVLTFELCRFSTTVAELSSLGKQTALPVSVDGQTLDLFANGVAIGKGELMAIGNGLGVRVTRLF